MKQSIKAEIKKLDNKGNTLGIVIVGIALLGILGSLILNITYANYQMKIADNQSKKTFYYVEKAIDEVYAGIGAEAMKAVTDAYQGVLTSMVEEDPTAEAAGFFKYRTLSDDETQLKFRESFYDALSRTYFGNDPTNSVSRVSAMLTELRKYLINDVDNIVTEIEQLSDTDIIYDNGMITMQNVKISSTAKNGYYSSITTDFIINLPNISLGFADTEVKNWDEFFKYAVIADGYQDLANSGDSSTYVTATDKATITVNGGGNTTEFFGNIYAGSSSLAKKNSLDVSSGSDINIASAHFVCAGPISMVNSEVNFVGLGYEKDVRNQVEWMMGTDVLRSYGLLDVHENSIGLRLFANSLVTEQPPAAGGVDTTLAEVNLNIEGDCFIADDLEINANKSKVRVLGNYFGYGFLPEGTDGMEAGSTLGNELNNTGDMGFEHEKRSAVIVNAQGADVVFLPSTYEDVVILAGRAYIDLVNGNGNATYMTGESVSIKGNQKVYKASLGLLGPLIGTNPIAVEKLKADGGCIEDAGGLRLLPSALDGDGGLDLYKENDVVAKRTNTSLYFYRRPGNAAEQTSYFFDAVTEDTLALEDIKKQAVNLAVENLLIGTATKRYERVYSVGIMTQVDDHNLLPFQPANGVGSDGKLTQEFYNLVKEMKYRYDFISSKLETFPTYNEYGSLPTTEAPRQDTVYGYFISEPKIRSFLLNKPDKKYYVANVFDNPSIPAAEISELCATVFGASAADVKPQVTVIDNVGRAVYEVEGNYGVVVATGDVVINQNFTGIIVAGGNVSINNGATLTACPPLAKFLAAYDPALQLLFGGLGSNADDDNVVDMSGLEYQNIITFDNWRKSYSEIN